MGLLLIFLSKTAREMYYVLNEMHACIGIISNFCPAGAIHLVKEIEIENFFKENVEC